LLLALQEAGWGVTCDALTAGDPDAEAAHWLDIPFPRGLPFAPLTPALLAQGAVLAQSAAAVVVAPVPWGPLNAALLDNALAAQRAGVPVYCLAAESFSARDQTQGTLAPVWNSLLSNGAVSAPDVPALLSLLSLLPPP